MIDVEQRALRPLEHDRAPLAPRPIQEQRHVRDPRRHALPGAAQVREHLPRVHRRIADDAVAGVDVVLHRLGQRLGVGQVADPHAAPRDLVFVRRADASRRGADLALAAARLAEQVELPVIRQDQVGLVADQEPVADDDPGLRDFIDLGEERLRVDDNAVADDAGDALVEHAGRQQPQHELAAVGVHGMPGVVPALVAGHDREMRREQVDDLALAFIPPLRAENSDVHNCCILLPHAVAKAAPTGFGVQARVLSAAPTGFGVQARVPIAAPTGFGVQARVPIAAPTGFGVQARVPIASPTGFGGASTRSHRFGNGLRRCTLAFSSLRQRASGKQAHN